MSAQEACPDHPQNRAEECPCGEYGRPCGPAAASPATDEHLLAKAENALRSIALGLLAVKPWLDKPYTDAPDQTPWGRTIGPEARRAHDLSMEIRRRLGGPRIRAQRAAGVPPLTDAAASPATQAATETAANPDDPVAPILRVLMDDPDVERALTMNEVYLLAVRIHRDAVVAIAAQAASAEREACARVAETKADEYDNGPERYDDHSAALRELADLLRQDSAT